MKAPMPQVNSQSAAHEDAEEADATEHVFHETLNTDEVTSEGSFEKTAEKTSINSDQKSEEEPAGRRRRRAASSGVITPGGSA